MFGLYGKLVTVALLASLAGGGIMYVQKLRSDLAVSEANNAKLEDAVDEQQKAIESLKADVLAKEIVTAQLKEREKQSKKEIENLENKFEKVKKDGTKRDIGKTSVKKPGLVEKIINKGTKDAYRCIEIETGSPLTESEINATKKSQTNSQCPDLANPNYIPK